MARPRSVSRFASRQALFFLFAIVLPCSLLVVLTVKAAVADAERAAAYERQRLAADVRNELLSRLERIAAHGSGPDVAFVGRVEEGRLILPWDENPEVAAAADALGDPQFRESIALGMREEQTGAYTRAIEAYRAAAATAQHPIQRAIARRNAARVSMKGGRRDAAQREYAALLSVSPAVVDDEGIPIACWAARGLISLRTNGALDETIVATIAGVLDSPSLPSTALRHARESARLLGSADLVRRADSRIVDVEQAAELQKSFSANVFSDAAGTTDRTWVAIDAASNLWLASLNAESTRLIAIRAATVLDSLDTSEDNPGIRVSKGGDGESLGSQLPGLVLKIPEVVTARIARDRPERPLYLTLLAVVISAALFGAYLFSRDVHRELRMADMRSQFVASVSHELRTPLTAIRMFAETMLLGRSTDPQIGRQYLETIVSESERLTRLLDNVLDFAKIEQGTKIYRIEPTSPSAVVRAAARAVEYSLVQHGFELRVTAPEEVPHVAVDADAIQQALLNLLTNAMKYSGDGRLIEMKLSRDGDRAAFTVTDHGLGIPPSEQTKIFEKFYRVSTAHTRRVTGTGLGLTLVDHIVRAHGGSVNVHSEPGRGSTFCLLLPFAREGTSAAAVAEPV